MNLIHFQGLNCYHDCVISVANHFGVDYSLAFTTLWSETDFSYDSYHKVYLTKRLLTNLEELGVKIEELDCLSQKDTDRIIPQFYEGEFMIIGMDAFYIPWDPFYQKFHGPHYFIAQNVKLGMLLCFDPTYDKKNEQLPRREIIEHAYAICRINRVEKKALRIEAIHEAREIVNTHPDTQSVLLSHIYGCIGGERENTVLLAKYIDAMINNRFLYRFFLESQQLPDNENHLFLNSDFFLEWKAVKNGLYKASISRSHESIINNVCDHFIHLMDQEIDVAEKIICNN